jgi:hypothetical protein
MHALGTYIHFTLNHTVNIECLHCEQYCSDIGALSLLFFSQKILMKSIIFVVLCVKSYWVMFGSHTQCFWVWLALQTQWSPNLEGNEDIKLY